MADLGLPNLQSCKEMMKAFREKMSYTDVSTQMWCQRCGSVNRFVVSAEFLTTNLAFKTGNPNRTLTHRPGAQWDSNVEKLEGTLLLGFCVTCESKATVLFKTIEGKLEALVFSDVGSISTKRTPEKVSHFLKQAAASFSVKAYSAVFAMYRSALDCILLNQGYQGRQLGDKINELKEDLKQNSGPTWAKEIDSSVLDDLSKMGSSSLHADAGNFEVEKNLTSEDVLLAESHLREILYCVYEKDEERKEKRERLASLREKKNN